MKRFDFRLKSVLVLRQRLLNEAEERYSRAIQARRNAQSAVEAGWAELDEMNRRVLATRGQRVSGIQQQGYYQAMDRTKSGMKQLEENLRKARNIETKHRNAYLVANRDHELLLKLKDKQHQKHLQDELLKEQLLQDDLFNARRAIANASRLS